MIAGIEWEFEWTENQISKFLELWNKQLTEKQIARELRRRIQEVEVLKIDLTEKKMLPRRYAEPTNIKQEKEGPATNLVHVEALRVLYTNSGLSFEEIALALGSSKSTIAKVVERQRKREPERWPFRKKNEPQISATALFVDRNQTAIEEFLVK